MYRGTKPTSLIYKFSLQISFIIAIFLAVLIISNVYSFHVVKTNMINNSKYTMAVHINIIQNSLNSISKDLSEIFEKNIDDVVLYPKKDENSKYFEALRVKSILTSKVSNNENIDALFIWERSEQLFLTQFGKRITLNEYFALSDYLRSEDFAENTTGKEWFWIRLNGMYYLIKSFQVSNIRMGALVKADSLMNTVKKTSNYQNQYVLTDKLGNILSFSDPSLYYLIHEMDVRSATDKLNGKYYVITENIPEFGKISNILESKNVLSGLDFMQWIILSLGVISLVTIPAVFISLSRQIIKPVLELVRATKEVEKGNWDYQLPVQKASLEFVQLFHSFASMIKEIEMLKINSYEEKLERNKAELRYLQMQIKPHFFLNAITTISSLTYQNKNEEIRRLINCLAEYLRYMFRGGLVNVTLKEEINHVKNYIHMQEIKFPNQIFHMIHIEQELEPHRLPQFLIQTFIENIFKHVLASGNILSIFIKVRTLTIQQENLIKITIEDNGEGFPEEIMQEVNGANMNVNDTGRKIGIANIKRTLRLLYKRDGLLQLSNVEPSGAKVEILIPMHSFTD